MNPSRLTLALLSFWLTTAHNVHAATQNRYYHNDFGGVGLIQMPSGRFNDEGEFSIGTRLNEEYHHYYTSIQVMPWLETTARYTRTPSVDYSSNEDFSGDNIHTDKGIDLKFRLLEESYWLPETAIGFRDIAGTGLFDGEFIAANKRWGGWDFTLGIGWGHVGNRNNLGSKDLNNIDCGRGSGFKGNGGLFEFDRFFVGCKSVFGGVSYDFESIPLTLMAEYDGNDYLSDMVNTRGHGQMIPSSAINVGAIYRLDDWGDIRVNYERGNSLTLGFSIRTNFSTHQQDWIDEKTPTYAPKPAVDPQGIDWKKVSDDLKNVAGYTDNKIYLNQDQLVVEGKQNKYRNRNIAHERAATILANTGVNASSYVLVESEVNMPITQTNIDATKFGAVANQSYFDAKITDATEKVKPSVKASTPLFDNTNPWAFQVQPVLKQSLGGSEGFYLFNAGVAAGATYWLNDHLEIGGGVYLNLVDNYDKLLYEIPADGTDLKRVRTLVRKYVRDSPIRVNNLQLTGFEKFGDNFYSQAYAGYLESMFAGVGGEVLYRPEESNWAFGLDLNYVKQRNPETQFGLFEQELNYDADDRRYYRVQDGGFTGHASVYYRPEWSYFNDFTFKMKAGKYLADDIGMTLDVSKQFASGVTVGAHVTKTNLSAEEFGEGSFNKGFYVSIPFDVFTLTPTTNRALISWNPLTRDGGQMLMRKYQLFNVTDAKYGNSEFTNK